MAHIFIFDLDGTLALIDHRRHLVEGVKKDWRKFFEECVYDLPNDPVISMAKMIRKASPINIIMIFSGRSEDVRAETVAWLDKHEVPYDKLVMRLTGSFEPDEEIKRRWLHVHVGRKEAICAVFDDRQKVVDMWRSEGLTCFQVAPGGF